MDQTHLGYVRNQSSNFVWLGEPQNSGNPKHYGGFRKDGIDITVNSFVLILSEGEFHHIGYIEDLYEDEKGSKEAKLRWFHRHIEVKDLFPDLDRNSEEIYLSRSIGPIDVEAIDSIATILTPHHYSRCLGLFDDTFYKPLSNCGIYMCCKEIAGNAIEHFDLSQLPGYSNQCILSLFHSHEESTKQSSDLPCGNPNMQFARRPRSDRRKKQKTVHSGDSNSISEEPIANSDASCSTSGNEIIENEQMLPPKMKLKQLMHSNSISEEQIANSGASCSNSGNEIIENEQMLPPKMKLKQLMHSNSISEEQIANSGASCSNSGNEIIENEQMLPPKMKLKQLMHSNSISEEQIANSGATCSNSGNGIIENDQMLPPKMKLKKLMHSNSISEEQIANSGASCSNSGNGIIENDQMPPKMKLKRLMHLIGNERDGSEPVEVMLFANENFEVLSPRFPGRWLRCQILLKSSKTIVVKYHDGEAGGKLEEVLSPEHVAPRDRLGMRLAGRMTLRPSPPHDSSNNSFQLGGSLDVWLHGAWCEGVFISPGDISTPDRFLVYLPDENILGTYHISDLRVSKDWVNDEWKEVPRKPDILSVISSMLAPANANPLA